MKRAASSVLLAVLLGLLAAPADAGGDKGDKGDKGGKDKYLTADGNLTATLEVVDVQGGFAGFTGLHIKVAKDGSWEISRVAQKKLKVLNSGQLSKDQLKGLAAALAKYDALGLKDEGKAGANPHNVTVRFGKHRATLALGAGKPLPSPSATEVPGRYSGIFAAVREAVMKGGRGPVQKPKDVK
jgi:hypothetical protein